jgi:intracellular septation protein
MKALLMGILPVVAFAIVEEKYGVIWGTIAGMIFGLGEVVYEKIKLKKVSGITWFSNILILVLGGASLYSAEGFWFKMQPAIFLFVFAIMLIGSSLMKNPMLAAMAIKQNPNIPPAALAMLASLNLRLSFVFLFLSALSTWAAFSWSTEAWAFLKSVGVFIILFAYMAVEILYRKYFSKN